MKQPAQATIQLGNAAGSPGDRAALVLSILDTAHALPGGVELFKYDCEILQHISSDRIVPIVELIELDDRLLIMSRDTGVAPLRDMLRRCGALSPKDAITTAAGVVHALKDIHARNAIYKTLCPSTIYTNPDLSRVQLGPPLLPFSPESELTGHSSLFRMLAYLSPEQIARAVYTNEYRSDFYSLGIVLFEMLTGAPPVPAGSDDILRAHAEGLPLRMVDSAEIPLCLQSVLRRLLDPDPGKRYQSATGLLHDLAECSRILPDNREFIAGAFDRSPRYVFPAAIYGHDEEIRALREIAGRVVQEGACEIALITGNSGMGKSALVRHTFGERMEFGNIITIELQPSDAANDYMALDRVTDELFIRSGVLPQSARYRTAPNDTTAEEYDESAALGDALAAALSSSATALVIENLHYAPQRLLSALALAVRHNAACPLMLLATIDSGLSAPQAGNFRAALQGAVRVHTFSPSPLGLLYIRQMIVDTFGETLEDTLVLAELVLRKTEGNPRVIRAFLGELVSAGVLYFAFGRWQCDVHKLRGSQASNDLAGVLSSMSSEIPYRVVDELFTALAVDDIVDRVTVRELKKEIRSYRRQSRRNKDFVEEVQSFLVRIAALMPELLFLFDIVQWRGIYANHDIRMMLGYNDTVQDTIPSMIALLHPDDRSNVLGVFERLRRVSDREVLNEEFRLKAADGSWQWFSAWFTVFNRNADGAVQCIFGSARNITPRKEAQAALAESEKKLSTIYNSVSDAIILVSMEAGGGDTRYIVSTVNQAFLRLSGMEREQLIGKELQEVFGARIFAQFIRHSSKAIGQRQPAYYEQEISLARGPRMFEATLTPVFDGGGECTHILISGHDITKRIRAEERILVKYRENRQLITKVNEQKSALMNAVVSTQEEERRRIALDLHDGLAQTLSIAKMNFSSFESQADTLNGGQRELLQTSIELLDSALRELSLVSYNLMPNTLYDFGLVPALEDMFHMINRVSAVRLAFHTHDYRRLAHQTEIILYRIIQELVNNAFRHSGASEISVQLIMHHKRLVVVVDDNGSGFEVEDIRNKEKSGLGLRSVETRVQCLNGSMSVDSHANSGTVVAVEIPLTSASFAEDVP